MSSRYFDLFIHRKDVFAQQQESGAYYPVHAPLTEDDLAEHFAGLATYGTYVIDPAWRVTDEGTVYDGDGVVEGEGLAQNTVKWFCFDLDTQDIEQRADLLSYVESLVHDTNPYDVDWRKALLLEATHGAHDGYHIWCFFDRPVPARQVRRWVNKYMPVTCEFFPKQDDVSAGGFGNLVRLPLGVHQKTGLFSEFVPVPGWASGVDDVEPLAADLIPNLPAPEVTTKRGVRRATGGAPASPFACVDVLFNEGAPKGCRDKGMFHLALYYFGHGIPEETALELCLQANEGFDPPLPEREVRAKVDSAYTGRYASAACGTDWLQDFCPGPCQTGWHVKQARAGELQRANEGDQVTVEVTRRVFVEGKVRLTVGHADAENTPTFVVRGKS